MRRLTRLARGPRAKVLFAAVLGVTLVAPPAVAAKGGTWVRSGQTFRLGSLDGAIEHPDGRLEPAPRATELGRPDTALVWDLLVARGRVFAATGEGGGLLELSAGAEPRHVASLDVEPEIFAVAAGPRGTLYVATGPSGAVYRLDPKRREAREIARPEASYIWDLAALPDGSLLVATGLPAEVLRVDPSSPGEATVVWSSSETHVRALALGPGGRAYAGTVGEGWLVEIDPDGGGFVLADSARSEAVALAVDDAGTVWAAFAGSGRAASGPGRAAPPHATPGAGTSITVRPKNGDGNGNGNGDGDGDGDGNDDGEDARTKDAEKRRAAPTPVPRRGGELIRLASGKEPETVWSDGTETPMALVTHPGGGVLLGTATPARVWWVRDDGASGLWRAVDDAQAVMSLARDGTMIALGAGNPAIVEAFDATSMDGASWTSDVLDAGVRARFGRVHAVVPPGAGDAVRVEVRAGNTAQPSDGWTPWRTLDPSAAGPPTAAGAPADLPLARFLQVRVAFDDGARPAPSVQRVEVRWRGVNRAPTVESLEVLPPGVALRPVPPSDVTGGQVPVVSSTVPEAAARQAGPPRRPWRSKSAFEAGALTLRWQGKDPDDDPLVYDVEACLDGGGRCETWVPLARGIERTFHSFDARTLADGVYRFRVTARDDRGNYLSEELSGLAISEPAVIDNTAPRIDEATTARVRGTGLVVRVRASDPGGRIAAAEVTLSGETWTSLEPEDGVADGDVETFAGPVSGEPGASGVTVRVTDASGNVTVAHAGR